MKRVTIRQFLNLQRLYISIGNFLGEIMNNINYDFVNTGYKIHLPIVPDPNDPLTRKIIDYLDDKFGLAHHNQVQYKETCYKLGSGGELKGGKGITLFGKTGSMQEMQELAKEIEEKFGKELADNVKKYNITFEDPIKLSNSVQARFSVYNHGYFPKGCTNGVNSTLKTYCEENPSGVIPTRMFTTIDGSIRDGRFTLESSLKEIDKKFWYGDSMMYSIDHFGELFTGKVEQGKVPQFIMDGLPKEYLEHYHLTEKDIIARINKGTRTIVANMLEDIVNNPNSKILCSNSPWLTTLDTEVINEAKQLLASYEPETVKKLEQMLPQLEQKCQGLSVLRKTTPFSNMKIVPAQNVCTSFANVAIVRHPVNTGNPQVPAPVGTLKTVNSIAKPTQVAGITAPATGVQMAKVDMDSVFSTFTRGECRPKVVKPTTPALQDVIEGALEKVHKPVITRPSVTTTPNMAKILKTVFTHIKI